MEEWVDIIGYENTYQVSSYGRVRSLDRVIQTKNGIRTYKGKLLKCPIGSHGYHIIRLSIRGKGKTFHIHQLVAIHFLGHTPCGHDVVVDHIDNDKTNNHVDNLQLISTRYNIFKGFKNTSSEFIGVYFDNHAKKWRAAIRINNKKVHLGTYINEEDAAKAYQDALANLLPK